MQRALTRASTVGPIVDVLQQGGGSVARVFRKAELPIRLSEAPDALVPLRDQLKLVELASQELGDPGLPARLAVSAGVAGLGAFGEIFLAAPSLGAGIARGNAILASTLQSATTMRLTMRGRFAHWTYEVTERMPLGRQKNEVLAIGYMVAVIRRFAGPGWTPTRVELPGALDGRAAIETLYRSDFSRGEAAGLIFPAELLDADGPAAASAGPGRVDHGLPNPQDLPGHVHELARLSLLEGRPERAWVARRLGMSVRTMQRRLNEQRTSFAELVRDVRKERAARLLRDGASVSDAAYELGFSDPAHFTRAFREWFGAAPRAWRGAPEDAPIRERTTSSSDSR